MWKWGSYCSLWKGPSPPIKYMNHNKAEVKMIFLEIDDHFSNCHFTWSDIRYLLYYSNMVKSNSDDVFTKSECIKSTTNKEIEYTSNRIWSNRERYELSTSIIFYYCLFLRELFSYSVVWWGIVPEPMVYYSIIVYSWGNCSPIVLSGEL